MISRADPNEPVPKIETTLVQLVLFVRILGFVWMTLLVIVTWFSDPDANRVVVALAEIAAAGWTVVTIVTSRNPSTMRTWQFVALDGAIALFVASASFIAGASELFHGGYPISWLAVAAYAGGMRLAVAAAVVLAAEQVIGFMLTDRSLVATTGAFVFIVYGVIFGWTIDTLRRNDARRRAAERALETERTGRALEAERLALANELHDSVLQTLQVIRTDADDADRVRYLVRSEERSIDRMINRYRHPGTAGFEAALLAVRDEVEDLHGVEIRTVIRDDVPLTPPVAVAVDATREALTNAARHSGAAIVNLYAEAHSGSVRVFVRDRGVGFDPTTVEEGRGMRHSLRERMADAGGTLQITSTPGLGTEVEICSGSGS
ncbi:MAG: ATP-binding protein [Acidimicrobiia bacterium]